ncbi:TetR/AcrR family transcriptional regulator [Pseudomonas veronii]|uniref:TetR/AcrR family transcriptional regulator n=1 Tax=Pseudomonas veronii TaxID=76761 RepID=UPI0009A51446|nr:TetR/AcrR family transcriptional regulator [Pseudomonas veronii]AQY65709.1 TetR family transcriptional regulator [Pseudomonas veronii]
MKANSDQASRGSADIWLDAAYETLTESGVEAVRIMPLAKKLNISRTSFYWFFEDRESLLEALVQRWREKNTGNIVKKTEAYAETIVEAVLNIFDCWLDKNLFDSEFEFAIRSWGLQSPEIMDEILAADELRIQAIANMFISFGYDAVEADVRARCIYCAQIGYISMKTNEDIVVRFKRIPDYLKIFVGRVAESRELDRFYSRHGYQASSSGAFEKTKSVIPEPSPVSS